MHQLLRRITYDKLHPDLDRQICILQSPMYAFKAAPTSMWTKAASLTSPVSFHQHQNLQFMFSGTMETR